MTSASARSPILLTETSLTVSVILPLSRTHCSARDFRSFSLIDSTSAPGARRALAFFGLLGRAGGFVLLAAFLAGDFAGGLAMGFWLLLWMIRPELGKLRIRTLPQAWSNSDFSIAQNFG